MRISDWSSDVCSSDLEPSVLDRIADGIPVNVERKTFPEMVADGTLYAHDGDVYWNDAGTPPTYLTANLDLVRGRRGAARSEERRVGKEGVSKGRSRWSPEH